MSIWMLWFLFIRSHFQFVLYCFVFKVIYLLFFVRVTYHFTCPHLKSQLLQNFDSFLIQFSHLLSNYYLSLKFQKLILRWTITYNLIILIHVILIILIYYVLIILPLLLIVRILIVLDWILITLNNAIHETNQHH